MPSVPADLPAMRTAIARWATAATGLVAFWRDQDAPPPATPYVGLKLAGFVWEATPEERSRSTGPTTAESVLVGPAVATLSIRPHSTSELDGILAALMVGLRSQAQLEPIRAAGLALTTILGPPTDLSAVVGSRWRHVANLDVRVRASMESVGAVSWIESSGAGPQGAVTVSIAGVVDLTVGV